MTMTEGGGAGVSVKALRSVHTGPEGVKAQYDARAVLRPDEVRIRVAAAGVNFRDVALQAGNYLPNMAPPLHSSIRRGGRRDRDRSRGR